MLYSKKNEINETNLHFRPRLQTNRNATYSQRIVIRAIAIMFRIVRQKLDNRVNFFSQVTRRQRQFFFTGKKDTF
jgi:hypothetical protein